MIFNEELSNKGIKATKQRRALLELLIDSGKPMTAEQMLMELKSNHVDIWPSTVYRSLELFCEKDIAVKIDIPNDGRSYYKYNTNEHKHLAVCLTCNRLIELENCPINLLEEYLKKQQDFTVTGHRLEFYGYCSACSSGKV